MTSVKERLQVVLCKARGCKTTTEDCNFKSCNSWGQCERIKEEILTELPKLGYIHESELLKMLPEKKTLEECEELAMSTDYAVFANTHDGLNPINKADAGAFYFEGQTAYKDKADEVFGKGGVMEVKGFNTIELQTAFMHTPKIVCDYISALQRVLDMSEETNAKAIAKIRKLDDMLNSKDTTKP